MCVPIASQRNICNFLVPIKKIVLCNKVHEDFSKIVADEKFTYEANTILEGFVILSHTVFVCDWVALHDRKQVLKSFRSEIGIAV